MNTHDIDAAAEREAGALAWLEDNLDVHQPVDRLRVERDAYELAVELRLPKRRNYRYPRGASVKAWIKILDAFAAGRIPRPVRSHGVWTSADRERAAHQRATLGKCIKRLPPRGANGKFAAAA